MVSWFQRQQVAFPHVRQSAADWLKRHGIADSCGGYCAPDCRQHDAAGLGQAFHPRSASLNDQAIIYNLADSLPAPTDAVLAYAASLLGLPAPTNPPDRPKESTTAAVESKKVDAQRILQALHATLCYPSYREGLQAIAAQTLFAPNSLPQP
jgi:hypothetical protein